LEVNCHIAYKINRVAEHNGNGKSDSIPQENTTTIKKAKKKTNKQTNKKIGVYTKIT